MCFVGSGCTGLSPPAAMNSSTHGLKVAIVSTWDSVVSRPNEYAEDSAAKSECAGSRVTHTSSSTRMAYSYSCSAWNHSIAMKWHCGGRWCFHRSRGCRQSAANAGAGYRGLTM
eukprot:2780209-Prymnesium_polylepis.3